VNGQNGKNQINKYSQTSEQRKNVVRFADEFLKNDGVFTIRMVGWLAGWKYIHCVNANSFFCQVGLHTGILFTSELVGEL
jgi:hypothetical protein